MAEDSLDSAQQGMAVVGEIIKSAGNSPEAKEAASNLGKTAVILTQTINNALLPLAAINYSFDKAKVYFAEKFEQDLSKKADKIPEEDIIEPKASIAGPALQGLAFTHEEENLKDMYLSLLATSMNNNEADDAHPAFVEIIKQLTSEEAILLKVILQSRNPIAISEVRLQGAGKREYKALTKHLINFMNSETGVAIENSRYPSMIDNWIRLGLVEVDYGTTLQATGMYDWNTLRPEVERLRIKYKTDKNNIIFQNGIIESTSFGKQFAKVVDI